MVITGLEIDLGIRNTQIPLDTAQLKTRNFLCLWSTLAAGVAGWLGFEPVPTPRMINLMDAWVWYDNLEDLAVDLPHGLVLISSEDIEEYHLKFSDGENLPYADLENYYNRKRWGVIKDLARFSRAVFEIGLPTYITIPAYLYFQTRWWNLVKPL